MHNGRTRTFLEWSDPVYGALQPLPPPRPRDHRLGKLARPDIGIAGQPVEEFAFRLIVIADEVEQRVEHFEVADRHAAFTKLGGNSIDASRCGHAGLRRARSISTSAIRRASASA